MRVARVAPPRQAFRFKLLTAAGAPCFCVMGRHTRRPVSLLSSLVRFPSIGNLLLCVLRTFGGALHVPGRAVSEGATHFGKCDAPGD